MDDRALHIVLVDDDEVDVLALRRVLAKANVTNPIHVASDARAVIGLLRGPRRGAWLVLLDLAARSRNVDLLRAMRDDTVMRAITVVALTTAAEDRERIEALRLGVAGYLPKPVTFGALAELMVSLGKSWTLGEPA